MGGSTKCCSIEDGAFVCSKRGRDGRVGTTEPHRQARIRNFLGAAGGRKKRCTGSMHWMNEEGQVAARKREEKRGHVPLVRTKTWIDVLSSLSHTHFPPQLLYRPYLQKHPAISSPAPLSLKHANVNSPAPSSSRHRNPVLTPSYLPHCPRRPSTVTPTYPL